MAVWKLPMRNPSFPALSKRPRVLRSLEATYEESKQVVGDVHPGDFSGLEATYEESKRPPVRQGRDPHDRLEATYEESKHLPSEHHLLQLLVWKLPMRNPSYLCQEAPDLGGVVWKLPMRNPSLLYPHPVLLSERLEATYEESKRRGNEPFGPLHQTFGSYL